MAGAAVALVLSAFGSGAGAAAQAPANRAAVVIDTGTEVRRVCIRFDAESITGKEALELAGADPSYSEFGGELGSFVCQLCGYPSPIGDCPSGGDNWWYHRADAGEAGFVPSDVGLSSTRVEDGDVEGWAWGRGGPPDFVDVDTVCGEVEVEVPTTQPVTTQPAPPDTTPTIRSIPSLPAPIEPRPGAVPTTTGLTTTTAATTSTSGGPTTSATSVTQEDRADGDLASASNPPDDGPSGGSPLGLAAVGTLLVVGLGGAMALRRRRSGPGTVPT